MGELAERFNEYMAPYGPAFGDRLAERRAICDAIAELEQRYSALDELHRLAASRVTELNARSIYAANDRAEAAERRADELLAAVSIVLQRNMRVVEIVTVKPNSHGHITLKVPGAYVQIGNDAQLHAALLLASTPPNPELLERASTQLAEAYIKAKAEAEAGAQKVAAEQLGRREIAVLRDRADWTNLDGDATNNTRRR